MNGWKINIIDLRLLLVCFLIYCKGRMDPKMNTVYCLHMSYICDILWMSFWYHKADIHISMLSLSFVLHFMKIIWISPTRNVYCQFHDVLWTSYRYIKPNIHIAHFHRHFIDMLWMSNWHAMDVILTSID